MQCFLFFCLFCVVYIIYYCVIVIERVIHLKTLEISTFSASYPRYPPKTCKVIRKNSYFFYRFYGIVTAFSAFSTKNWFTIICYINVTKFKIIKFFI